MSERRFVELCETCRDAIREAGGEVAYMPMLRSEALDLAAAAREEGRRAGWAEAIAALRSSPQLWMVGWSNAELDIVADHLADQAPKEETHD